MLRLGHKELHSFDGMSAFASLLKHAYKQTALELGDGPLLSVTLSLTLTLRTNPSP